MALSDAPVVRVLKFDEKKAYNPDRPISSLIRTQLLHLHHAENIQVPLAARTNTNINNLLTERQASEYIHKVTILLHQYGKSNQPNRSSKRTASAQVKKQAASAKSNKGKPKSR
jgi:hypothetical protein